MVRSIYRKEMSTEKFIICECHGHGLLLDYFISERDHKPYDNELYISTIGSESYFTRDSFWDRIRLGWKTFKSGSLRGGEAVLSEENAANLVAYINNFLIESEK